MGLLFLACFEGKVYAEQQLTSDEIEFLGDLAECESQYNASIPASVRGVLWNPFCCFIADQAAQESCLQENVVKIRDLARHMGDVWINARKQSNSCPSSAQARMCTSGDNNLITALTSDIACLLNNYQMYEQQLWSCLKD